MPLPRYKQINVEETPFYHCTTRCVRQSFLCGVDRTTGIDYEHRRQWIVDRMHSLSEAFAIDLCAYAVMHNHIHVVLHIAKGRSDSWSMDEVILRWRKFYKCPSIIQRYLSLKDKSELQDDEVKEVHKIASVYRQRLQCISWFMRMLNEYIARKANKEDKCTGYFWERRFRSQAILDERALAAVMAYVDLNPIRAGIAKTPITSDFTSIKYRLNAERVGKTPKYIALFKDHTEKNTHRHTLPFTMREYVKLLDQTRQVSTKPTLSTTPENNYVVIHSVKTSLNAWQTLSSQFEHIFKCSAGTPSAIKHFANACNYGHSPNTNVVAKLLRQ